MREFAAAGGGGAKRQRPLFLILRSRQPVRQVSRERESLAQRGGGHRGHKAKKKKRKEKGSSHRSSLARRPVILRVARAQHPYLRRAPPSCLTLFFAQLFLCFHSFFDWDSKGILLFPIFKREKEEFEKKKKVLLSGIQSAVGNETRKWQYPVGVQAGK